MADREIIVRKANKTVYREGNVIVKEFVPGHPKAGVYNEGGEGVTIVTMKK